MLRKLLICGLVAGFCGGLLAAGFASLAGERAVDRAIAYEAAKDSGHHEAADPAPVSRGIQKSAGLLTASVVYGLALGGIFALAFAFAYGRVARVSPRTTAYGLAAAAFVVVYLVPFLKYPASPPGATDPDTIVKRTLLYATMIAISVLAAVAAARVGRRFGSASGAMRRTSERRRRTWCRAWRRGWRSRRCHEIPSDFPATALWTFREASIGMQP
jgi:hypothetical protein